jgi:hypothetical protein
MPLKFLLLSGKFTCLQTKGFIPRCLVFGSTGTGSVLTVCFRQSNTGLQQLQPTCPLPNHPGMRQADIQKQFFSYIRIKTSKH